MVVATMQATTRAVVYCRVSDPGAIDDYGMDAQEQECRSYAARQGWRIVSAHREFHTGTELFERPELTKIREAMRRGAFDVLLVDRLDRLSRDADHHGFLRTEAKHAGVTLASATEMIDDSFGGRLVQTVKALTAQDEKDKNVRNMARGKLTKVAEGKPLGQGKPSYGLLWRYESSLKRPSASVVVGWQDDPTTIDHLRRIFADYDAGLSLRQLAKALEADGVLPPYHKRTGGTRWSTGTLRVILSERLYIGEAEAYRTASSKVRDEASGERKRRHRQRPPEERMPLPAGVAPVVIDPALFARVQARLAGNKERATDFRTSRNPEVGILRRGLAYCGQCGNKLVVLTSRGVPVYSCQGRERTGCPSAVTIPVAVADAAVWDYLTEALSDDDRIRRHFEHLRTDDPTADDLATVDRQRAELERQQASFIAVIQKMQNPEQAGPIAAQLDIIGKQLAANARTREAILQRQAAWQHQQAQMEDVLAHGRTVAQDMERVTDWAGRRAMAQALKARLELFPADHKPRWIATSDVMPSEIRTSEADSLCDTSVCIAGT
jgi:site-specific DNA recombinase